MTFYLLYYLTIGAILTVGYLLKNKLFTYIAVVAVILVSGLRYGVGYDYPNYVSFFLGYGVENTEPLFQVILFLLSNIWNDPQIMFFSFSLATIFITYIAIHKLSSNERTSFLIYLLIPGLYLNSFSIIRQAIAISLFFLGIYYSYREKKRFFIIGIIASLFHLSAIFPFFLLWLLKRLFIKKWNFYIHLTLLSVAFIIAFLDLPVLIIGGFGKYSIYTEMLLIKTPITKVLTMFIFATIVVFFLRKEKDEKTNLLLNIFQLGIFINIAFSEFPPVTRMGYYFLITQTVLVPTVIYSFKKHSLKLVSLLIFMTYYFGIQINALTIDEEALDSTKMTPYKSYLEK